MASAEAEKRQRLIAKLERELGAGVMKALVDDDIIEIILNPDGKVWLDSLSKGMYEAGFSIEPMRAFNIITTIASVRDKIINDEHPFLECTLPIDGSRFSGIIPEVVENPAFNIRKRALRIHTLDDYVASHIVTAQQAEMLRAAISERASIMIAGGPGTGKTTFANALLNEMVKLRPANQRFVIVEDKFELQCSAKNRLMLKTTDFFSWTQSLRYALVARPDVICLGEARGAEVLILLKAWNTGTKGGISTVHANDAYSALSRIESMIEENAGIRAQPSLITEAVDVICAMSFHPDNGRKLNQVLRIKGHNGNGYILETDTWDKKECA